MHHLIVGAGCLGLATALQLAQDGHEVTVIDSYSIPSPISASNDLNKIIRTEYDSPFYTELALEALKHWQDNPLYAGLYVQSGRVTLSPSGGHRAEFERESLANLEKMGINTKRISTGLELGLLIPAFKHNRLRKINASFNSEAGYAKARESLLRLHQECLRLGVKFHFGDNYTVTSHTKDSVIIKSGRNLKADKIIIATGANTTCVIPGLPTRALGLFVTHVKLTDYQYHQLKDIPVFFSAQNGYFFPPEKSSKLLKFAMTFADCFHLAQSPGGLMTYVPKYGAETFPVEGENQVRQTLSELIPSIAQNELTSSKICWISDSPTSDFLIDLVPGTENIYVATGDSGHAFKFMPVIGKYISRRLHDNLREDMKERWSWKKRTTWPTDFKSRIRRPHLQLSTIKSWFRDSKL